MFAVSCVLISSVQGTKCACFEPRSFQAAIAVNPPDRGSPTMKSTEIDDHCRLGVGNGWSRPADAWRGDFDMTQAHELTYFLIHVRILGHQKSRETSSKVFSTPKWPAICESCLSCNTLTLILSVGTKIRPLSRSRPSCNVRFLYLLLNAASSRRGLVESLISWMRWLSSWASATEATTKEWLRIGLKLIV